MKIQQREVQVTYYQEMVNKNQKFQGLAYGDATGHTYIVNGIKSKQLRKELEQQNTQITSALRKTAQSNLQTHILSLNRKGLKAYGNIINTLYAIEE